MHSHRCTTTAGAALLLTLLMLAAGCGGDGGDGGTGPSNRPPTVSVSLETNYEAMVEGEAIVLQATASDPDFDVLTYSWSATTGTFDDATVRTVTWRPSAEVGEATITCEVSDGRATATASTAGGQILIGTAVEAEILSVDTTWSASASPYVVRGDVTVAEAATLTVEPGVTVYLRPFFVGQSWVRPQLDVRGTLDATGTGDEVEEGIRFLGGRVAHVQSIQHKGILLAPSAAASLSFVTVRDGDVGLRNSASGTVELRRCTLSDNTNGFTADGGSTTSLVDCEVRDNLVAGIFVSGASVSVRSELGSGSASRIRNNLGSGIVVGAPTNSFAFLSVEATQFSGNGQGHLTVNNSGGGASVQVTCSDLASVPEGSTKVVVQDPFCFALSMALTGNFWGGTYAQPNEIVGFFEDGRFCDAGVDAWSLASGDWTNLSALGSCPTTR